MKCAVIARHRAEYPLTLMCRVLGIARSAFYAWQRRRPSARAQADAALRLRITAHFERSHRNYGSPRIVRDLRAHPLLPRSLRVSVGTRAQNDALLNCVGGA